jgi:hypothetical protein
VVCTVGFGLLLSTLPVQAAEATGDTKGTDLKSSGGSASKGADDIVSFINKKIKEGWEANQLRPSGKATDAEWCRRAHLDLVGRVPTIAELDYFMKDNPAKRKENLIDRLLGEVPKNGAINDKYLEEYANNWSTIYTNLLIGRPMGGNQNNVLHSRDGMAQFLRRSFLENKPYDQLVQEVVSAEGDTTPGMENYNGAANFYIGKLAEDAAEATSRTARYFLGLQVQCTQCHNHPFNDWKQDQFWSFNAFFRQTKSQRGQRGGNGMEPQGSLYNADFTQNVSDPRNAELYYELRNGTQAVAYPKFVDGTKINASGYVKEVNRRAELGKLIVKSDLFGKAIANRIWAHFMGYGFTKPVDDMGPHNPASHPELVDRLGAEFVANGNDLKKLMKWVMLSEPYSLSSKMTAANKKDDPSMGVKPMFSHFYMRSMEAEQLYESIATVRTQNMGQDIDWAKALQERNNVLSQFTLTFGTDDGDDATTFNGTIPQALMLFNGNLTKACISTEKGNILGDLLAKGAKPSEILDRLFLATYGRKPTSAEAGQLGAAIKVADPTIAYQDLLWSLINSNEFLFVY